jgi:hypothetical protein
VNLKHDEDKIAALIAVSTSATLAGNSHSSDQVAGVCDVAPLNKVNHFDLLAPIEVR